MIYRFDSMMTAHSKPEKNGQSGRFFQSEPELYSSDSFLQIISKVKRIKELANEAYGFPAKKKLIQNFITYLEKQMNKRGGNSKTAWNIIL